jgi:hypothetical protein
MPTHTSTKKQGRLFTRTLSGRTNTNEEVRIEIILEQHQSRKTSCRWRLSYKGLLNRSREIEGIDGFDAFQNALIVISADLYALRVYDGVSMIWEHAWDENNPQGFPSFPGYRSQTSIRR